LRSRSEGGAGTGKFAAEEYLPYIVQSRPQCNLTLSPELKMKVPAATLLVVAIVALIGLSLSAPVTVGQAPAPIAVKWEYLAKNFSELAAMSAEGEQGWELVAVVQQAPAHSGVVAYFKRPKN
jgi:hypothetical protein